MSKTTNFILSAACAVAVSLSAMPANAAPATNGSSSSASIAGIRMDQIQNVDRRGWRNGGGYGNRGWNDGGRRFSGGGYRGGRYYGGGRRYYGGYGHRRGRNYGGYAAAGVLGLAAGAIIANNAYGGGYYGDSGYYGGTRYSNSAYGYVGPQCRVISRGYDDYGRPVRVIRYRPC